MAAVKRILVASVALGVINYYIMSFFIVGISTEDIFNNQVIYSFCVEYLNKGILLLALYRSCQELKPIAFALLILTILQLIIVALELHIKNSVWLAFNFLLIGTAWFTSRR